MTVSSGSLVLRIVSPCCVEVSDDHHPARVTPSHSALESRLDACTTGIVVGPDDELFDAGNDREPLNRAGRAERPNGSVRFLWVVTAFVVERQRRLDALANVQRVPDVPPGGNHHGSTARRAQHAFVFAATPLDA